MAFKMISRLTAVLGLIVLVAGCESATRITGSWYNKKATEGKTYGGGVFIAALTANLEARQAIEASFAEEAKFRKIKAVQSLAVFGLASEGQPVPNKETILTKIRETGVQTIMTVSVKDIANTTRYVPGTVTYEPMATYGYYGGFYGYYNTAYTEVYNPGYYTTDRTYFLECNLYDVATEELLWSAQSETTNPGKIKSAAKEYARVVVNQMVLDGLLKKS
jgi:hypothetical protein